MLQEIVESLMVSAWGSKKDRREEVAPCPKGMLSHFTPSPFLVIRVKAGVFVAPHPFFALRNLERLVSMDPCSPEKGFNY